MPDHAPNLNTITLLGQLTADPELRETSGGRPVCHLRLAVNDRRDQPPLFIDIAAFGKEAAACGTYLRKGRQVAVVGRLVLDEWETKDGDKRSKHQVIGRVRFGYDRSDEVDAE